MAASIHEWRIHPDGTRHAIRLPGDHRYACGEFVLPPKFAGRGPTSFCATCLERVGVMPDLTDWAPGEVTEAFGR